MDREEKILQWKLRVDSHDKHGTSRDMVRELLEGARQFGKEGYQFPGSALNEMTDYFFEKVEEIIKENEEVSAIKAPEEPEETERECIHTHREVYPGMPVLLLTRRDYGGISEYVWPAGAEGIIVKNDGDDSPGVHFPGFAHPLDKNQNVGYEDYAYIYVDLSKLAEGDYHE